MAPKFLTQKYSHLSHLVYRNTFNGKICIATLILNSLYDNTYIFLNLGNQRTRLSNCLISSSYRCDSFDNTCCVSPGDLVRTKQGTCENTTHLVKSSNDQLNICVALSRYNVLLVLEIIQCANS